VAAHARISAADRRQQILGAALELFARDGLHGTTTKAIADAAGISEALLYRHFAGKEELFETIQSACIENGFDVASALARLPKCTRSLVIVVHFMASQIIEGRLDKKRHRHVKRLMLTSLAGDGVFARGFTKANVGRWIDEIVLLVEAARDEGDTYRDIEPAAARVWFAHHLFAMIGIQHLQVPAIPSYGIKKEALVEEAVRFSLRGVGLKPDAIARNYKPAEIDAFIVKLIDQVSAVPRRKKEKVRA
jgi:AcrR family transcriptional regulator